MQGLADPTKTASGRHYAYTNRLPTPIVFSLEPLENRKPQVSEALCGRFCQRDEGENATSGGRSPQIFSKPLDLPGVWILACSDESGFLNAIAPQRPHPFSVNAHHTWRNSCNKIPNKATAAHPDRGHPSNSNAGTALSCRAPLTMLPCYAQQEAIAPSTLKGAII